MANQADMILLSRALNSVKHLTLEDLKIISFQLNNCEYIYDTVNKRYTKRDLVRNTEETVVCDPINVMELYLTQYFTRIEGFGLRYDGRQQHLIHGVPTKGISRGEIVYPREMAIPYWYTTLFRYCQIVFLDHDYRNKQDNNGDTFLMRWIKSCDFPLIYECIPTFLINKPNIQNKDGKTLEMIVIEQGLLCGTYHNRPINDKFLELIRPSNINLKDRSGRTGLDVLMTPFIMLYARISIPYMRQLLLNTNFLKDRPISNTSVQIIQKHAYLEPEPQPEEIPTIEYPELRKHHWEFAGIMIKLQPHILDIKLVEPHPSQRRPRNNRHM